MYVDLGAERVKNFDDGLVGLTAHELPFFRPASQLSQCEKSSKEVFQVTTNSESRGIEKT